MTYLHIDSQENLTKFDDNLLFTESDICQLMDHKNGSSPYDISLTHLSAATHRYGVV